MQTFLPYPDFTRCAQALDRQRLGKQRVEVVQLLRALAGDTAGWGRHPATLMWRGHERALARYGLAVCREWVARGYRDNCAETIRTLAARFTWSPRPRWLGDERLHASHRAALLHKLPEHYEPLGWGPVPADYTYHWPTKED